MNSLGPKISQLFNTMHSPVSHFLNHAVSMHANSAGMRDLTQVVDQLASRLLTGFLSQSLGLSYQSGGSPFFMPPPVRFVIYTPFDFGTFFSDSSFGLARETFKPYKLDFESPLPGYRRQSANSEPSFRPSQPSPKPEPSFKADPPVQQRVESPTLAEKLERAGDDLESLSRRFDTRSLALTGIQDFRAASLALVRASDQSSADQAKAQVEKAIGKIVRKLSLSVHPDKNPEVGSNQPFQQLTDIRNHVLKALEEYKI